MPLDPIEKQKLANFKRRIMAICAPHVNVTLNLFRIKTISEYL